MVATDSTNQTPERPSRPTFLAKILSSFYDWPYAIDALSWGA